MRTKKPTLQELSAFTRAYLTAAFWTSDEDAPPGEYSTCGRPEQLYERLTAKSVFAVLLDCHKFRTEFFADLTSAGTDEQNGHDFWLTRNHHGVGFWDRGYPEPVANRLTAGAHGAGERNLTFYKGRIYYQ